MLRLSILLVAGASAFAQQYTISTVAGGAPPATPAPATSTSIGVPHRLLIAGSNLYFSAGNSVFRMDSSGTITLIAGNSRAGFSGDGGPAANARLNSPQGMALDSAGNLYIADSLNNRVRMVDPNGIISTFAGNGGFSQPGFWGDGGPATDAQIHAPVAVAIDKAGQIYIVAAADNTIRVVDTNGMISIFAGAGYKGYYGDTGNANVAGITSPEDMTFLLRRFGPDRRYRQRHHPQSGHRRHHLHRVRQRFRRPLGRRRRHQTRHGFAVRCGGGFLRQFLHRRVRHESHPQGRYRRQDHDRHWRRQPGLRRRRRPCQQGGDERPHRGGARWLRQPVLRRFPELPHPQTRRRQCQHLSPAMAYSVSPAMAAPPSTRS